MDIHVPVMMAEVIENMDLKAEGSYLDATFGHGGHSGQILAHKVKSLVGMDRDPNALAQYKEEGEYRNDSRLSLIKGKFSQLEQNFSPNTFDAILIDLGPSSRQLLRPERGFSFSQAGPLDMRMDPESGDSLLEVLDKMSERELSDFLNQSMRGANKIASMIKAGIAKGIFNDTLDLAKIMGPKRGPKHPATKLFAALRILVNREYEEIELGIPKMIQCLKPGGRLVVITFHSDEDRLVKYWFKHLAAKPVPNFDTLSEPLIRWVHKKAIKPNREEVLANPRSRSAKVRCVEKL